MPVMTLLLLKKLGPEVYCLTELYSSNDNDQMETLSKQPQLVFQCCLKNILAGLFILTCLRGVVKGKYLMKILGYFFLFLHKNIYSGYSLYVPQ